MLYNRFLSILYIVVCYVFQSHASNLSLPPFLPWCPCVCSLHLCLKFLLARHKWFLIPSIVLFIWERWLTIILSGKLGKIVWHDICHLRRKYFLKTHVASWRIWKFPSVYNPKLRKKMGIEYMKIKQKKSYLYIRQCRELDKVSYWNCIEEWN